MDIFILSGGIEVLYSESPPSHSSLLRFLPLLIHIFFSFLISSEHINILCISACKSTCLNWPKNQLIMLYLCLCGKMLLSRDIKTTCVTKEFAKVSFVPLSEYELELSQLCY